jgi:hypothetical protein
MTDLGKPGASAHDGLARVGRSVEALPERACTIDRACDTLAMCCRIGVGSSQRLKAHRQCGSAAPLGVSPLIGRSAVSCACPRVSPCAARCRTDYADVPAR